MDEGAESELQHLRVRAYGPDADIDAAGIARLRALEAAAAGTVDGRDSGDRAADDRVAVTKLGEPASPAAAVDEEPAAAPSDVRLDAPARGPSPARALVTRILWPVSVVAAAAAAAALTFAATAVRPVSEVTGAEQIATLDPSPGFVWPEGFFGPDVTGEGYEFSGLTILRTDEGIFAAQGECLTVLPTEAMEPDSNSGGPIRYGCRAGSFPATVQFGIDAMAPAVLRDAYPDVTALRFVLEGERIGVFVDRTAEDQSAAISSSVARAIVR